jgi:membrane associated rhomboid family serine protease
LPRAAPFHGKLAATGGVAFRAHIGGFVAGVLLVFVFKKRGVRLFHQRVS